MFILEDITNQIHPLKLVFNDSKIEQKYRIYYQNTYIKSNQLCLVIGILFYAFFGIIDLIYGNSSNTIFQLLRYGVTIPITVILFLLSFSQKISHKNNVVFTISLLFFSASIVTINILADSKSYSLYIYGMIILLIFGQNFLKILYYKSTAILFSIVILFIGISLFLGIRTNTELLFSAFFITLSFVISTISAYYFEYIDRKNFWNQQQLYRANIEYKELQSHLEQKVIQRTQQLESAFNELEFAKSKIEESNIIKSTFLSIISHEIRTPLTSILGFSQLIVKSSEKTERNQKYVESIEKSIRELLDITSKILTLSEIQDNRLELTSSKITCKKFKDDIEQIAQTVLQKRNKELEFIFTCDNTFEIELPLGEKELHMIFTLLLDNAVKYTISGDFGCVCNKTNTDLEFSIYDTGIGISKENATKIFDFFTQENQENSRTYDGIGVGLSICKGIIVKSGGQIWIESEKNKGTKVFITLPIINNT